MLHIGLKQYVVAFALGAMTFGAAADQEICPLTYPPLPVNSFVATDRSQPPKPLDLISDQQTGSSFVIRATPVPAIGACEDYGLEAQIESPSHAFNEATITREPFHKVQPHLSFQSTNSYEGVKWRARFHYRVRCTTSGVCDSQVKFSKLSDWSPVGFVRANQVLHPVKEAVPQKADINVGAPLGSNSDLGRSQSRDGLFFEVSASKMSGDNRFQNEVDFVIPVTDRFSTVGGYILLTSRSTSRCQQRVQLFHFGKLTYTIDTTTVDNAGFSKRIRFPFDVRSFAEVNLKQFDLSGALRVRLSCVGDTTAQFTYGVDYLALEAQRLE